MGTFGTILTIAIGGLFVHGFPGKLSEQRYEFQPLTGAKSAAITTTSVHPVQHTIAFEPSLKWSQQHPNEVNAFAEVYRQSYNHLVEQHNRMFGLQYGYLTPVHHQLFNLPEGYSWQDYFGSQQQYVEQQTEEMSRRLFYEIQHGRITQQDLEIPSFFINQVADLLDRVHSHVQEEVPPQVQQKHENLYEMANFNNKDYEMVLAFNPATGSYEYVYVKKTEEKSSNVRTSYIQSLPPAQFNNRAFDRDIESSESLEELTTPVTVQTTSENYYASTYDQQQQYDLQYLESISSTPASKPNNVMSLVRKKQTTGSSTSTTTTTTTTTTTSPKPTTESNVMSMLPHKQPRINYTDIQQQIRQAIDRHMKQYNDTENGETHFMGMNSNQEHVKLTYDVVDSQQSAASQPAIREDQQGSYQYFVTEEPVKLATIKPMPETETQRIAVELDTVKPKSAIVTQRTVEESPLVRTNPTQRISTETIPLYSAPLAPLPIVVYDSNPYYTAPLAPFPGQMLNTPSQALPVQFSELDDMNQEHFLTEQHAQHFPEHDDMYQEVQVLEQIPVAYSLPEEDQQFAMTHVLGLQKNTQSSTGLDFQRQHLEREQPPEQAYRTPELVLPQTVVPIKRVESVQITTVVPAVPEPHQKPWLQRQWTKLTKHF